MKRIIYFFCLSIVFISCKKDDEADPRTSALKVTVLQNDDPSLDDDKIANIIIFKTQQDWENDTNRETTGFTDTDGVKTFYNLEARTYYLFAWRAYNLNDSTDTPIITPQLKENQTTEVIIDLR